MFNNTLLELMLHIKSLTNTAYLVGGCVRDIVIGNKQPNDFDIVTDCDLDALKVILSDNGWSIKEAGMNFLVLIASKNKEMFEVAIFRKDGTYTDGRRPDSVEIGDIHTDCDRRDITINALYLDPFTWDIKDPSGKGLRDIQDKIIRMNGNPNKRIEEDKLRIMRVYRFSNQLGFEIEKKTAKACRVHFNDMIKQVSGERIKNEVEKMCIFQK